MSCTKNGRLNIAENRISKQTKVIDKKGEDLSSDGKRTRKVIR